MNRGGDDRADRCDGVSGFCARDRVKDLELVSRTGILSPTRHKRLRRRSGALWPVAAGPSASGRRRPAHAAPRATTFPRKRLVPDFTSVGLPGSATVRGRCTMSRLAILPTSRCAMPGDQSEPEGSTANVHSMMAARIQVGGYSSSMGLLAGGRVLRMVAG
jgi:hypothetical protein